MEQESRLETALTNQRAWVNKNVAPWAGSLLLFALLRGILEAAANVHWAVGLVATIALTAVLAVLLLGWRQQVYAKQQHSRNDVGVLLFATLLMAIAVFSAASMLIYQFQPDSYTGPREISMSTFTDYYLWLTADALPGIRFSDTFGVTRPIEHQGWTAAICLLVFRVLVLSTLLKALKEWMAPSTSVVGKTTQMPT